MALKFFIYLFIYHKIIQVYKMA